MRERVCVGGGLVLDAKGQLSGADDSVCVCVCTLCLAAHVCASILIYFCLAARHMCLLCEDGVPVFVCVCLRVEDEAPG